MVCALIYEYAHVMQTYLRVCTLHLRVFKRIYEHFRYLKNRKLKIAKLIGQLGGGGVLDVTRS